MILIWLPLLSIAIAYYLARPLAATKGDLTTKTQRPQRKTYKKKEVFFEKQPRRGEILIAKTPNTIRKLRRSDI